MNKKSFLIVGGSSGIGLEITRELKEKGNEIHVASRSSGKLADIGGVYHHALDVQDDPLSFESPSDMLHGLAYCPGTIRLKPFHRLTKKDFLEDLQLID